MIPKSIHVGANQRLTSFGFLDTRPEIASATRARDGDAALRLVYDPSPPPGWYPDPARQTTLRYWDGQGWVDGPPPLTPAEKRDSASATRSLLWAFGLAGVFGCGRCSPGWSPATGAPREMPPGRRQRRVSAAVDRCAGRAGGRHGGDRRAGKRKLPKAVPAAWSLIAVVTLTVTWFVLLRAGTPASMW